MQTLQPSHPISPDTYPPWVAVSTRLVEQGKEKYTPLPPQDIDSLVAIKAPVCAAMRVSMLIAMPSIRPITSSTDKDGSHDECEIPEMDVGILDLEVETSPQGRTEENEVNGHI